MNYQGQKLKDCKPTSPQLKKKRQRQENSLGELTKNFIDFVRAKGSEEININDIVKKLKVKKRRIYDITNVLEGIGYIKKLAKNKIIWIKKEMISLSKKSFASKTSTNSITNEREINEIISLQHESDKLDNYITILQNEFQKLSEQPDIKEFAFVTVEDLKQIAKCDNQNLIAIKAPQGTSIEIPDKESTKEAYKNAEKQKDEDPSILESLKMEHQMFMESQNGEITVYLVLTNENETNGYYGSNTPLISSSILNMNKNIDYVHN